MHGQNLLVAVQMMVSFRPVLFLFFSEKVAISSLYSDSPPQEYSFDGPVKCVAIDPDFAKTQRFVCGLHSGSLIFHRKGL